MSSVDERLRVLEEEVARIKRQLTAAAAQNGNWWERIAGSMRDFPEFEEVLRLGREYRSKQVLDEPSGDVEV